jgi:Domain of unknown function (DUF4419)
MLDRLKSLFSNAPKGSSLTTLGVIEPTPSRASSSPNSGETGSSPAVHRLTSPIRPATGITFPVDDVVPAAYPLWVSTLGESAEIRSDASILIMPDQDIASLAPEGYGAARGETLKPLRTRMRGLAEMRGLYEARGESWMLKLVDAGPVSLVRQLARTQTFLHPLVQAVHIAFSDHRPLVLMPDSIWLTIMQGFGHHVNENAEALRDRIVRHEGKKKLCITTDSLDPACWPAFMSSFSALIKENSDPVLHETLLCEFSTTTPSIKTACEVTLMDTYQRYFEYEMSCVCGIPSITLEGTVEDWQRIRERIEVLATFELDWWTSRVTPILDQFVATAKGEPDREFWQAIYKPKQSYAAELASGWIADLFPYLFFSSPRQWDKPARGLGDSPRCERNPILPEPRSRWLLPQPKDSMFGKGVCLDAFPSGLSRAPIKVKFLKGPDLEVQVMGGFLGVSQRPDDYALAPVISWAVVQEAT